MEKNAFYLVCVLFLLWFVGAIGSQSIPHVLEGPDPKAFPVLARTLNSGDDVASQTRLTKDECHAIGIPDAMCPQTLDATLSVAEIVQHFRQSYGGSMSVEYSHCKTPKEREWWIRHFEGANSHLIGPADPSKGGDIRRLHRFEPTPGEKKNAHTLLSMAERFESFLARKFETLKRYSGEGAEAMLPALGM